MQFENYVTNLTFFNLFTYYSYRSKFIDLFKFFKFEIWNLT